MIFHAVEVGDGSDGRWSGRLFGELPALIGRWATDEARTPEGAAAAREQSFGAFAPGGRKVVLGGGA
ncbi:hypothetical protein D7319_14900 [Streptomyces radicis]|uniref:Uncharacterized protein n=2 Tax=Streptomyces radicis TaxID=1750517 RepID=A0A3A9WR47_9ACTN|nr:hypothetical protein D7319_14900 [Streptomyces radicis]RKN21835.1 hypothetical protein D7318_15855 [Streptomyces radicis]